MKNEQVLERLRVAPRTDQGRIDFCEKDSQFGHISAHGARLSTARVTADSNGKT